MSPALQDPAAAGTAVGSDHSCAETALWHAIDDLQTDHTDAALHHTDQALRAARTRPTTDDASAASVAARLYLVRSTAFRARGRLGEALASARDATACADSSGDTGLAATAWTQWQALATLAGVQPDVAAPRDGSLPHNWFGLAALAHRASADLVDSGPRECATHLAAAGAASLSMIDGWLRVGWYETLAHASAASGRLEEAGEWATRAGRCARELAVPSRTGLAALARAHVRARLEPTAGAAAALDAARTLAMAGAVLDAARARGTASTALVAAGDPTAAAREQEAARHEFIACGAYRLAHPNTTSGQLTPRERQLAALVRDELTNRQIAGRLAITEKTVEMHLSRMYRKLGVASRLGLVRTLWYTGPAVEATAGAYHEERS